MDIFRTASALRAQARAWHRAGLSIGLVPTMGYLHDGHLSLARIARARADRVVVSIFVNPTQFGPGEDLDRYPRDEAGDLEALAREGVDAAFLPSVREMYPEGAETFVQLERLPEHLCGMSRPVHFRGVATVCTKLFAASAADVAVFGEKDYQQLLVIRRMARDLLLPVEIVGGPIVREADGLAMSSRNAYLSPEDRRRALAVPRALDAAEALLRAGETDAAVLRAAMAGEIAKVGAALDYAAIVDPDSLDDVLRVEGPARAAIAALFGPTRLIDNRLLHAS
jgi:pantoate--beta-alanine ligase